MAAAERALKGREGVLDLEGWNALVSRNISAMALQRQGLPEARALTEQVLAGRETSIKLNNLARLYIDLDELDLAKTMLERTLAGEAEVVGAEGYDVVLCRCQEPKG